MASDDECYDYDYDYDEAEEEEEEGVGIGDDDDLLEEDTPAPDRPADCWVSPLAIVVRDSILRN